MIEQSLIDRELAKRGLINFVRMAWPYVEPAQPFISNWHIEAICEHLEAIHNGELRRLVINVPPGSMKSLSCCVFYPAWEWTQAPEKKLIFSSYSERISFRDSDRTKELVGSDWYRERWGDKVKLKKRSTAKFTNTAGGFRMATTVAGGVTGEHADTQFCDDPIKPFEVTRSMHVATKALESVLTWWNDTMSTRMVNYATSARVIIMQRLHEGDLAGEMLKTLDYEHLMLPMEYEPARKCTTSIGFEDPRTEEGELLFEARFPRDAVEQTKKDLGPSGAQAQLQQNPTPKDGGIFSEQHAVFYTELPDEHMIQVQSWDCTFKKTGTSFVAGHVWGQTRAGHYYLLHRDKKRYSFTETCTRIEHTTVRFPKAYTKLVEAKANGPAIVDSLERKLSGLKLVEPEGGKEARAFAMSDLWEEGKIHLPHPSIAPWVKDFMAEVIGFPSMVNDDDVDAMTQAIVYLESKNILKLKKAMENA